VLQQESPLRPWDDPLNARSTKFVKIQTSARPTLVGLGLSARLLRRLALRSS
jgi:hypothetical protein